MTDVSARAVAVGAALTAAGMLAVAGCGSPASPAPASVSATGASAAGVAASPMATSFATALDSWAVVPMVSDPSYWQMFVRAADSASWRLATPPGVAINGGIVASATGASALTVAVRPSDKLTFSPLAATADGGASWSPGGPIDAPVAASPGALAANGSRLVALLGDGTIETSTDAGATWSMLAKPGAIAASPAARGCAGAVDVTSVSFETTTAAVLAAGTCGTGGTTALFAYSPAKGWQRVSLPVSGRLVRFAAGTALVQAKAGLTALFGNDYGWYAYAPPAPTSWRASAALPVSGPVTASGTLASGGVWVLLPGGRAATVSAPGQQWVLLPPVPARTTVLASGPDGAVDALAVSGTTLTVWRLAKAATVWSAAQTIKVPIQYGSSG